MVPSSDENAETIAESRRALDDAEKTPAADVAGASGPQTSSASRSGPLPSFGSSPQSGALPTAGPSLASIVMQTEEATRARVFFRLTAGVICLVLGFMTIIEGPPFLRAVAVA